KRGEADTVLQFRHVKERAESDRVHLGLGGLEPGHQDVEHDPSGEVFRFHGQQVGELAGDAAHGRAAGEPNVHDVPVRVIRLEQLDQHFRGTQIDVVADCAAD